MLHSLDLLIGFSTVMATLSLVVTILTQIAVEALRLRASHLHEGLLEILGRAGIELREARRVLKTSGLRGRTRVTLGELTTAAGAANFSQSGAQIVQTFDAAMRSVSDRFTTSSRLIAATISVVVAFGLPLDMLDLFRTFSSGAGVLLFPQTLGQWIERWRHVNVAGVGGSAVLLSLGAPFWFEVLKDLLRLKGAQG
jgi:hypothetical protein